MKLIYYAKFIFHYLGIWQIFTWEFGEILYGNLARVILLSYDPLSFWLVILHNSIGCYILFYISLIFLMLFSYSFLSFPTVTRG